MRKRFRAAIALALIAAALLLGGKALIGAGWLEIEARGSSGVRYRPCDVDSVPQRARDALTPPDSSA